LEFFANDAYDPSGNGEGKGFLGATSVSTDASCNAAVDVVLPVAVPAGWYLTATATVDCNTSEFSACRQVTAWTDAGPAITNQPVTQSVALGSALQFCVGVEGAEPMFYQWRFNGMSIGGATDGCLTLTNASYAQAGFYTVEARNACGTNNSLPAILSFLDLHMYAGLALGGPVGIAYRIDYAPAVVNTNDWRFLRNVVLTTNPQMWFDLDSPNQPKRFYRAVPQP
jgi:hypothetical protein